MKLIKTAIKTKQPKNTYIINVNYEHGDGDSNTTATYKLKNKTEDQVIAYLTKFNEVAQDIDNHRSYGMDLPDYIKDGCVMVEDNLYIELEQDNYTKLSVSDYYACMILDEVIYYDENGNAFKVEMKE